MFFKQQQQLRVCPRVSECVVEAAAWPDRRQDVLKRQCSPSPWPLTGSRHLRGGQEEETQRQNKTRLFSLSGCMTMEVMVAVVVKVEPEWL